MFISKKIYFYLLFILVFNFKLQPHNMITNRRLGSANWGTHMPALLTAVMNTKGPILELGCGDFSTTLLHAICSVDKRYILSAESEHEWLQNFLDLETSWHKFLHVPINDPKDKNKVNPEMWNIIPNNKRWSVVLVDHAPGERRKIDIQRFANNADIIIIHDTQAKAEPYYKYQPVIAKFKYKYVYKRYWTQTTLVSNTIDIAKLFN